MVAFSNENTTDDNMDAHAIASNFVGVDEAGAIANVIPDNIDEVVIVTACQWSQISHIVCTFQWKSAQCYTTIGSNSTIFSAVAITVM